MSYPSNEKKLINFNALSSFAGDNTEFSKQLISAFLSELLIFETHIKESFSEEEFLSFRKAYHSISPSLQMLEIDELITAIDTLKLSYTQDPSAFTGNALNIRRLLKLVKEEALQWQKI